MPGPGHRHKIGEFKKVKKGTFTRILKEMLAYKVKLTIILLGLFVFTGASILANLFMKILIDDYITPLLKLPIEQVDFEPLVHALFKFGSILFLGVIASFTYSFLNVRVSNGILRNIRQRMYKKMQKFPLKYFDTNKAGDIMSRYTNDLDTFRQTISQAIPQTIAGILETIMIFGSLIMLSPKLFIVVIFMCTIMVLFTVFIGKSSLKSYRATQKEVGGLSAYVEEMILGTKEVKVYCYEDRNIEVFNEKNKAWAKAIRKGDFLGNILMPCMNSLGNILYVLVAFTGALFGVSIGTITSFMAFTKHFSHLIAELSSQIPFIMQSLSGAERIYDLIDTKEEIDNGHVTMTKTSEGHWVWKDNDKEIPLLGNIVLQDVNFSYEPGKQVLKNINVYADKGQKVALVGATGAGKTTITNLINRFYEIDDGKITFDGINVTDIKKEHLRYGLSIVLQDVNMFSGTILDNIKYGNQFATDEECIKAAKLVHADKFIEKLPDGYNSVISGNAGRLSQGQKQLISIARAAVADPPVLILDEATSSIDTRTEKLIEKGMDSLMRGRTTFIIAHRLSTIRNADVIMVMQNGEIVERGNHDSLLAKKGLYYELYTGKVEID